MRKFMTSLTAVATLTLAAVPTLGLLQAAHAAEPSATISLVGLNLSNPAHAAEFLARVDAAGEKVCSARPAPIRPVTSRWPAASTRSATRPPRNCRAASARACTWPAAPRR